MSAPTYWSRTLKNKGAIDIAASAITVVIRVDIRVVGVVGDGTGSAVIRQGFVREDLVTGQEALSLVRCRRFFAAHLPGVMMLFLQFRSCGSGRGSFLKSRGSGALRQ